MNIFKNIYFFAVTILYVLYFLNWFHIWDKAPEYLYEYNIYFQTTIAIVIIVLFNPVYKFKMNDFYRTLVFSCGVFLFTNIGLNIVLTNINIIRNAIKQSRHIKHKL